MKISFKLLENNQVISDQILKALLPEANKYLKNKLQYIRTNLPPLVMNAITNAEEYSSLVGGQLQYEFGIPDPSSKLNEILRVWSSNIIIQYNAPTIAGSQIKGSFSISIIRSDFSDVLSADAALVIDNLRGYQLPWLEWLLLEGNKIIIPKQQVEFGANRLSRTGYAVMRPANKSWRVPSEFAGTISDNWITRAIENNESQIADLLNKVFI